MIHNQFAKRFTELAASFSELQFHANDGFEGYHVLPGDWKRWATSAQSLILAVFGESSPHYQNFVASFAACDGWQKQVLELRGVFLSAKDDFDGDYVFNVDLRVSGEVFGDFVTLAKEALASGNKDVAGVLACAALEDSLKRFTSASGFDAEGKTMQEVINLLKSKGLVSGAQKTILESMPRIRNMAMHGDWEKLTAPEVSSVLGFVEQFLITKFSAN